MKRPPKMKKLYKLFYINNLDKRPGYRTAYTLYQQDPQQGWSRLIDTGAYDFLTYYAGPLNVEITGDANLDADLMDKFSTTFLKYFWNVRIGFKRPEDFYANLSAFLNEHLPLWAQFFNEAIYKRGSFVTNAGQVFVNDDGTLTIKTTNDTTNNTTSGTNTTTAGSNQNKTTTNDKTTNDSKTTGSTESTTTGDNTQEQHNNTLSIKSTTPQDQINYDKKALDAGDLNGVYDFSYADEVDGNHDANNLTTHDESTTHSNNDSTTKANGTSDSTSTTNGTNSTTTQVSNNSNGTTNVTGTNDQTNNKTSQTTTEERNASVFELASQLNRLANGAYLNLFTKAKQAGLFLLTYY